MEDLSDPNLDPSSTFDYTEEDHDSDVEARLYAEIYYSNTIIGEEDHLPNPLQSELPTKESGVAIVEQSHRGNDDRCNNISAIEVSNTANHQPGTSSDEQSKSIGSKSPHTLMKNHGTRKSNEPHSGSDCSENNNPTKKRKVQGSKLIESYVQGQSSSLDTIKLINGGLTNGSEKLEVDPKNKEERVNPTSVTASNREKNLTSGSPASLKNAEKSGKKLSKTKSKVITPRKSDFPGQVEDFIIEVPEKKQNNAFNVPKENHNLKRHSKLLTLNRLRATNTSPVIDLTAESPTDFEKESKYKISIPTNEKLERKESKMKNMNPYNPMSDSEESIFEVPVPPKPAPPIIELKDSDAEQDSDSGGTSDDSIIDLVEETMCKSGKSNDILDTSIVYDIDSDSDERDELILNCTQVQKGAISLKEIRNMSHEEMPLQEIGNESGTELILKDVPGNHLSANSITSPSESHCATTKEAVPCKKKIPIEDQFFQPMTSKMKAFYNNSWGGENFDIGELKKQMSSDPKKWSILADDLAILGRRPKRYFGVICSRCHKDGHRTHQCPEPFKVPVCHMCGTPGHHETACPHKKCLSCGRKSNMYRKTCGYCERITCARCKSYGHLQDACPDLWRRYHHTIKNVAADIPRNIKNVMKPQRDLSCCNCAKRGHDSYSCHKLRWSQHFPNPSNVANYNGPAYIPSGDDNPTRSEKSSDAPANSGSNCSKLTGFEPITNSPSRIPYEKPTRPHSFNSNSYKYVNQNSQTRQLVEVNEKVIFKVQSDDLHEKMLTEKVMVKVECNKDHISNYEIWKPLSEFLSSLTKRIPSMFSAIHGGRQISVSGDCSSKHLKVITEIVRQFAYRSSSERSHMYLKFDLNIQRLHQHLSDKLSELREVKDDALKLYEELKKLKLEVIKSNGQDSEDLRNSIRNNKITLCLKKLLMILYREGFADGSLKKLRKISLKLSSQLRQRITETTLPLFLKYVDNFNSVFASHEPRTLSAWIKNYEDHMNRCNRLREDPLLNPVSAMDLNGQPLDFETCANTSTERSTNKPMSTATHDSPSAKSSDLPVAHQSSSSNSANLQPGSNSHLVNDFMSNPMINLNNPNGSVPAPLMAKAIQNLKISNNAGPVHVTLEHPHGKYNEFYLHSLIAKTVSKKQRARSRFRSFIQEARGYLEQARQLNTSRMQMLIVDFENKLKNEIFLKSRDVSLFKKKLKAEKVKLRKKITNMQS